MDELESFVFKLVMESWLKPVLLNLDPPAVLDNVVLVVQQYGTAKQNHRTLVRFLEDAPPQTYNLISFQVSAMCGGIDACIGDTLEAFLLGQADSLLNQAAFIPELTKTKALVNGLLEQDCHGNETCTEEALAVLIDESIMSEDIGVAVVYTKIKDLAKNMLMEQGNANFSAEQVQNMNSGYLNPLVTRTALQLVLSITNSTDGSDSYFDQITGMRISDTATALLTSTEIPPADEVLKGLKRDDSDSLFIWIALAGCGGFLLICVAYSFTYAQSQQRGLADQDATVVSEARAEDRDKYERDEHASTDDEFSLSMENSDRHDDAVESITSNSNYCQAEC